MTWLVILVCVVVFFTLTYAKRNELWPGFTRGAYYSPFDVWNGAYWALLTSNFVHLDPWHLAFNMYWLWVLGSALERVLGPARFLLFYAAAAIMPTALELVVLEGAGCGASGVTCAMFSFMAASRNRILIFRVTLDAKIAVLFVGSLFLTGLLALTNEWETAWDVAHLTHVSGLALGIVLAELFILRRLPRLALIALAILFLTSTMPLVWCPWSTSWLCAKAYEAHEKGEYPQAIELYGRAIDKANRPRERAWAYANRGRAYLAMGEKEKALADAVQAREIEPNIFD